MRAAKSSLNAGLSRPLRNQECRTSDSAEGRRYVAPMQPGGGRRGGDADPPFSKFLACVGGRLHRVRCPAESIFFVALQCCVPLGRFPCSAHCMEEYERIPTVPAL